MQAMPTALKKIGSQAQLEFVMMVRRSHREDGMRGIRERVTAIGGTLTWRTGQAGVNCCVPLVVEKDHD